MMIRRSFLIVAVALSAAALRAETPAETILHHAERYTRAADAKWKSAAGTFVEKTKVDYRLVQSSGTASFVTQIAFAHGKETHRLDLGGDTTAEARMMRIAAGKAHSEILLDETVFPYHRSFKQGKQVSFTVSQGADDEMSGRFCHVLDYTFEAASDSIATKGKGRLWVAKGTDVPVRAEYELKGKKGSEYHFKVFVDLGETAGRPIILRNENQADFLNSGGVVARMTSIAERSDYSVR